MPQAARPKYEKQSIWCSMMVFMLYFFVFREENDVDHYIANISDPNLAGLEMQKTIKNYKKEGKDTSGIGHHIFLQRSSLWSWRLLIRFLAKFSLLKFLFEI